MKKITYPTLNSWIKKLGRKAASEKFWNEIEKGAYATDIPNSSKIDAAGHTFYFNNGKSLLVNHSN